MFIHRHVFQTGLILEHTQKIVHSMEADRDQGISNLKQDEKAPWK